jgi:hypothetical protein
MSCVYCNSILFSVDLQTERFNGHVAIVFSIHVILKKTIVRCRQYCDLLFSRNVLNFNYFLLGVLLQRNDP